MWYFAPILFLTGCLTDVIWTIYIQKVSSCKTKKERSVAAFLSVGTGIVSTIWAEGVIHTPLFIPFWWVGLWCGTYYASTIEQFFIGAWNVIRKN